MARARKPFSSLFINPSRRRVRERDMECQVTQRRRSVVLVPCPFQGHMSPMLQLGSVLHSKGFAIIVAHTEYKSPNPSTHPEFLFLPISDGLSDRDASSMNPFSLVSALNTNCRTPLQERLTQVIKKQEPHGQVACIIYDSLMYSSEAVANDLNLPSFILRTSCVTNLLAFHAIIRLQADGHMPFQDSMLLDLVPGFYPFRFKDLPLPNSECLEELLQLITILSDIRTSSAIICNTMDYLENSPLSQLQQHYQVPFFTIGPLHKMAPASSYSFLEEDTSCVAWLDKQAPNSVIYISLGSSVTIDRKELTEIAWGLANSDQPFLWVVRPGLVRGSEWIELLPEGFKEITGERGCIVKWAPQQVVLAHAAVGGFWSHCGWNSTLETVCEGVPVICWPRFIDQKMNSRYLTYVWRIGLELEHVLERGEIARAIRRVMVDKEGEEMRQRAIAMAEKAKVCVLKGGSSYNSLIDLAEFILSF